MTGLPTSLTAAKILSLTPGGGNLRSSDFDISPGDTICRRWRPIIAATSRINNIHSINLPNRNNAAALARVAIEAVVPVEFEAVACEGGADDVD